jgi:hypothetical protein
MISSSGCPVRLWRRIDVKSVCGYMDLTPIHWIGVVSSPSFWHLLNLSQYSRGRAAPVGCAWSHNCKPHLPFAHMGGFLLSWAFSILLPKCTQYGCDASYAQPYGVRFCPPFKMSQLYAVNVVDGGKTYQCVSFREDAHYSKCRTAGRLSYPSPSCQHVNFNNHSNKISIYLALLQKVFSPRSSCTNQNPIMRNHLKAKIRNNLKSQSYNFG